MNSRERHEFYSKNMPSYKVTGEERVMNLVNELIAALYIPIEGFNGITKVDTKRLNHFGIDEHEPINWGDLKCIEVENGKDYFIVIIDEAAPNDCQTFCEYIEKYMRSYGWEVRAKTEW